MIHVTFQENVFYIVFHFSSFFYWSPWERSLKNEVSQKVGGYEGSNKKVTRLRTFLEASTKFENINSLLFSLLLLRIDLESISEREGHRPLLWVIIGVITIWWLLPYSLSFKTFDSCIIVLSSFRYPQFRARWRQNVNFVTLCDRKW